MSQPPPNGPYQGPPPGMPPQGPHTGGQPPMGPPTGGQPPMGPPPGGPPPGGPGDPGDPYGQYGGDPYGQQGDPYAQQQYGGPGGPGDPYGNPYQQQPQQKKTSPWLFVGLGCGGLFIIGVVLVVLIAFVFNREDGGTDVGVGSGERETTTDPVDPGEDENDPGPDASGMQSVGTEFPYDGMNFVVTSFDVTDEIDGTRPSGEYLVVEIDVADASGTGGLFWMDEQHVYTDSGQEYEEDYDLTRELNGGSASQSLESDGTFESVTIAFDVPDADEITYMGLSTQTYGGNEINVALN